MGEFFMELKPLGVVAAVVSIVWLTAMSDIELRREGPTLSERYHDQVVDAADDGERWNEGWGLVNVEVEAE